MVIEAVDPTQIDLTSMSGIYKVFDNLHMLWMGIWMCPPHITAAHVDQAFGIYFGRILGIPQATNHGKMH